MTKAVSYEGKPNIVWDKLEEGIKLINKKNMMSRHETMATLASVRLEGEDIR